MKKLIGKEGEKIAFHHLKKEGYKILSQNYQKRFGEVDIIAEKDNEIIFIEIRSKRKDDFSPILTITQEKIRKLKNLALSYLSENGIVDKQIRFDIIGIVKKDGDIFIEHLKNAF